MIRAAFVGNSHTACVKLAWDIEPIPGMSADFFAAPQKVFAQMALDEGYDLALRDGRPRARDKVLRVNGTDHIDLSGYDLVVLVGQRFNFHGLAKLLCAVDVEGLRETGLGTLLSVPAFRDLCSDLFDSAVPGEKWRNRSKQRLLVVPQPRFSAACLAAPEDAYAAWKKLASSPEGVRPLVDLAFAGYGERLAASGVGFLPHPPDALDALGLTLAGFQNGAPSVGLDRAYPQNNFRHMNADYGALVLAQVRDTMKAATAA